MIFFTRLAVVLLALFVLVAAKSAPHVNGRGQPTKHHPANDKAGWSDDLSVRIYYGRR
jgi:hypothetical protein